MPLPDKVIYAEESEYRAHFEQVYCQGPIITADGIRVYFKKYQFNHCMFESSKRDKIKDVFSSARAERIGWIKETLTNPDAELYQGWDREKKRVNPDSRVAIAYEDFVVIIRLHRKKGIPITSADFITAYQADNSIGKIKKMPKWEK